MTILTPPGWPGNPLDTAAIAAGIFPFDSFTTNRPITLFVHGREPGHLLPDLITDINNFIPAAELALRKTPTLAGLVPKAHIELMVRLCQPESHVRRLVPDGRVTDELYQHLLFLPASVTGMRVRVEWNGGRPCLFTD
jgi:hypothetical protein